MTQLDWIIVVFAVVLACFGFRQGFIVGVLSFGGFALGAFLGTRIGPILLPGGSDSPYAAAFGLVGALLGGAVLASGLEGLGLRLRRGVRIPGLGLVDGLLGAILSAALALGIVWIAAAVIAQAGGGARLRSDIQKSAILGELNRLLPPSGGILDALARLDPLPQLTGPLPRESAPAALPATPGLRTAARSVVRVVGSACGLAIEGSGWVVAPETVVTNAHVVAGERDTMVEPGGRLPGLAAQAIAFNPRDDIAILHVPDLSLPSLSFASTIAEGRTGAVMGFPENGAFRSRPARIGRTQVVVTQNAYGQGAYPRLLTPLRGLVQPGNSGGPLVSIEGRVLTTVFASATAAGRPGGYGVANKTVRRILKGASGPVSTGPCSSG